MCTKIEAIVFAILYWSLIVLAYVIGLPLMGLLLLMAFIGDRWARCKRREQMR